MPVIRERRAPVRITLFLAFFLSASLLLSAAVPPGHSGCHPRHGCAELDEELDDSTGTDLSIVWPGEGAEIAGVVQARGSVASDLDRVSVEVGGLSFGAVVDGDQWSADLDVSSLVPGSYELQARARGPRGRRASSLVPVVVVAAAEDEDQRSAGDVIAPEPDPDEDEQPTDADATDEADDVVDEGDVDEGAGSEDIAGDEDVSGDEDATDHEDATGDEGATSDEGATEDEDAADGAEPGHEADTGPELLFADAFGGSDRLVTNEYAFWNPKASDAVHSTHWQMRSGSAFVKAGTGWTGRPDDVAPDATSSNGTNSAVFRLVTHRDDFRDVSVGFDLLLEGYVATPSTPAVAWDGVHVFLRHRSPQELYYVSVDRRDDVVTIKKKVPGGTSNGGTYHTLATATHRNTHGNWQRFEARVVTNPDGSVTITAFADGRPLISAKDAGTGGPPITGGGSIGLRGDNTQFRFRNLTVHEAG